MTPEAEALNKRADEFFDDYWRNVLVDHVSGTKHQIASFRSFARLVFAGGFAKGRADAAELDYQRLMALYG